MRHQLFVFPVGRLAPSARKPLVVAIALMAAAGGQLAYAGELTGPEASATVDTSSPVEAWTLNDGATLNVVQGGGTNAIMANTGSTVNITGGSVSAAGGTAVTLADSNATLNGATIVNSANGIGLNLTRALNNLDLSSSLAQVANSTITSVGRGLSTVAGSDLTLSNTMVEGTNGGGSGLLNGGIGGTLIGGTVKATDQTRIVGDKNGLVITAERQPGLDWTTNLTLDQSTVEGRSGAAIVVDSVSAAFPKSTANIVVANGSNLIGGNGNLLEVNNGNTANLIVDNSVLSGNVVADAASTAAVTLQNNASLTGQLTNVANLAVNSGAIWNLTGSASVQNVALSGGAIKLSDGAGFNRLDIGNLSGNGLFDMRVDLAALNGDFLNVSGAASGGHDLAIKNTGVEPRKGASPLQVVQIQSGDANFQAVGNGGMVDAGAFQYSLERQGNGWYLVQARGDDGNPIPTPSTESTLGLFNVSSTVWYGELASLRSRMGDVRLGRDGAEVWARTYGNRHLVNSGDLSYQQNQYGLSLGTDAPVHVSNGRLRVGVLGGYSRSDLDFGSATTGSVDSFYLGGYATWLSDNGVFVDGLIKGNVFRNNAKVTMSDGTPANGGYTNYGLGTSVEVGRHIPLGNRWFVEPSITLSAFLASGVSTTLDNGLQASGSTNKSLQARLGAAVGRNFEWADGSVMQPYLKLGVVQEFARSNDVNVNGNLFNNNLAGTRVEVGAGVVAQLSSKLQLHGDVTYGKGNRIEQPWGFNAGLRYVW